MLGISQHGITLINDLKPLDVVVSDKDTLILIDHPMLKSINSLIIYSRIQDQHIDSINILLQKRMKRLQIACYCVYPKKELSNCKKKDIKKSKSFRINKRLRLKS